MIMIKKSKTKTPTSSRDSTSSATPVIIRTRSQRSTLLRDVSIAFAAALVAASAALFAAGSAAAQEQAHAESPVDKINAEAAKAEISVQSLRGHITMLSGSGGNISVFTSKDGKLMVDGGIAVSRPRLSKAIDSLGPGSLKYLIDTHWHWDHTDGNDWLHAAGATIIGHENTLKRLSESVRVEDWTHTFPPAPAGARPTVIVDTDKTLEFGGETLVMHYYGPCHTDSDMYVYFKKADVLAVGDTFWNGVYPFIDIVTGGSIDGMIRAANVNIALATDHTIVVGGHGPVGNRAQLIEFRDMLAGIRKNVAQLKGQGKSLEQTIAAKPTARWDAKWGNFVIDPAFFTRLVYRGV
jgi:glyoxylase-like metal-dependent hydrolase (beta-lactamase superfamily II)